MEGSLEEEGLELGLEGTHPRRWIKAEGGRQKPLCEGWPAGEGLDFLFALHTPDWVLESGWPRNVNRHSTKRQQI